MPGVKDTFVNQAYLEVTESAANTLTFKKLETGISIYEKVGWLINRIDYKPAINATVFANAGDGIIFGLSVSNGLTSVDTSMDQIIDYNRLDRVDFGTAANGFMYKTPFEKSFSNLKGGGLLIPPNPIYIFMKGQSLATAQVISCRMFYTVVSLKAEDFWELVEQRRMIAT